MTTLLDKKELTTALVRGKALARKNWPALGMLLMFPGFVTGSVGGEQTAMSANLHVTYQPSLHLHESTAFTLVFTPRIQPKEFSLRIGKSIEENFTIQTMNPAPLRSYKDGEETIYIFPGSVVRTGVVVTTIPEKAGTVGGTISYGLDPPVALTLTTLP